MKGGCKEEVKGAHLAEAGVAHHLRKGDADVFVFMVRRWGLLDRVGDRSLPRWEHTENSQPSCQV